MGKKLLLTGANGFLGQFLVNTLKADYNITTIGRKHANIVVDLAQHQPLLNQNYDLVIHAAGKAHSVPASEAEKKEFFDVNVIGTENLLKALEKNGNLPEYFVFISSVSVYGVETGHLITEDAPLLAEDAYGKSKIEAETMVKEWCGRNNVICTILRLPLLAGANPPGNLGAMIKGVKKGYYFNIAGGKAQKSMVLAADVANAIQAVVVAKVGGVYNLTDRYHPTFCELSNAIAEQLNRSKPVNMPLLAAKLIALVGDLVGHRAPINSKKLNKIILDLTFDDTKAVKAFGWQPRRVLEGLQIL